MRWDIFCRVIDNHGDLGVCWRLARQLAEAGEAPRLWVDDASALAWMAPRREAAGVQVIDWSDPAAGQAAAAEPAPDVLIEAFGCDPSPALIERFAAGPGAARPRAWINLEYLSAEAQVERLHTLPSPVLHGPGAGLTKWFFYPGFTAGTGGLLREPGLAARQTVFDRGSWLQAQRIGWRPGERLVSLFCYEPPALADLLEGIARGGTPTRLLVTHGRAAAAVRALPALANGAGQLRVSWLPWLAQEAFDPLLWSCDLNLVRGEDSFVRALWAGAPMAWQIYPQDDGAHHAKLDAWLDWIQAPPSLRAFHHAWNGTAPGLPPAAPDTTALAEWRAAVLAARTRLLAQDDLLTQLRRFVTAPG
ncbi:MAG: elongation factor P maturation arginine rhamnosyltransferase EarP [Xenophilus sp.]